MKKRGENMTSVEHFKEHSVAEFFKKNKQMLGFSGRVRSLTTIVHEYITNSLDACEEHGILPNINVEIKNGEKEGRCIVIVEDNGPGLPLELVGKAFGQMLAGTKFHRYMQQRGQQGIGAAGCTMFALITTGKGVVVRSRYEGKEVVCKVGIDFATNKPVVEVLEEKDCEGHGIRVEGEFGDVKYDKGKYGVAEYLKRTAISNPHAEITLIEPDGNRLVFPRCDEHIPRKPKEVLPHPLGVTAHDLHEMAKREQEFRTLSSFLQNRFARITNQRIKELEEKSGISMKLKPNEISWEQAEELVSAFKQIKWIAPSTDSVIPIGKEQIEKSISSLLAPQFYCVVERSPKVFWGGVPFIVEVALAYGIKGINKGVVMRYANRVPLLFDAGGCAITEAIKAVDWKRYGIKNFDEESIVVFVNLSSVYVPYTGAGKQAISQEEEIMNELRNALNEAGRVLSRYISGVVRAKEREGKMKLVRRYVAQLSQDLSSLSGEPADEIAQHLYQMIEKKYMLGGKDEQND